MNQSLFRGFPDRVRRIEGEFLTTTRGEIRILRLKALPAAAEALGGIFIHNCVVTIQLKNDLSQQEEFETLCHEMLHLELSLRGYPNLEGLENDENATTLIAHLESLLQHLLIMPIEKAEFGYDPYASEVNVAKSAYDFLSSNTNFGPPDDPLWQFVYSSWGIAYARCKILATHPQLISQLDTLFQTPGFTAAANIATSLETFVRKTDFSTSSKYVEGLRFILQSIVKGNRIDDTERIIVGGKPFSQTEL